MQTTGQYGVTIQTVHDYLADTVKLLLFDEAANARSTITFELDHAEAFAEAVLAGIRDMRSHHREPDRDPQSINPTDVGDADTILNHPTSRTDAGTENQKGT